MRVVLDKDSHRPPSAYVWLQNRDIFGVGVASFYGIDFNALYKNSSLKAYATE